MELLEEEIKEEEEESDPSLVDDEHEDDDDDDDFVEKKSKSKKKGKTTKKRKAKNPAEDLDSYWPRDDEDESDVPKKLRFARRAERARREREEGREKTERQQAFEAQIRKEGYDMMNGMDRFQNKDWDAGSPFTNRGRSQDFWNKLEQVGGKQGCVPVVIPDLTFAFPRSDLELLLLSELVSCLCNLVSSKRCAKQMTTWKFLS